MVGVTNPYYQQSDVQALADYVKYKLFCTEIVEADEDALFDPLLTDFVAKVTLLQFIPAAVDYWGDQLLSETTTGTSEVVNYPDRRDGLWKIFDHTRKEVAKNFPVMSAKYKFCLSGTASLLPRTSYGTDNAITADPADWDKPYEQRKISARLPWVMDE